MPTAGGRGGAGGVGRAGDRPSLEAAASADPAATARAEASIGASVAKEEALDAGCRRLPGKLGVERGGSLAGRLGVGAGGSLAGRLGVGGGGSLAGRLGVGGGDTLACFAALGAGKLRSGVGIQLLLNLREAMVDPSAFPRWRYVATWLAAVPAVDALR